MAREISSEEITDLARRIEKVKISGSTWKTAEVYCKGGNPHYREIKEDRKVPSPELPLPVGAEVSISGIGTVKYIGRKKDASR